ncbi:MAG: hypothetical protein QM724_11050 [Flavobacteriales bacterium]
MSGAAWAQPCSIDLGPDVDICQGQTTVLHGPPGMDHYLWDTGETTQDITTGVGGKHWCRVTRYTGNLVPNGDFSAGNTGFTSQFNYNSNLIPEPTYFIDTQTETHHNNFHASHNGGNFLMANAGASNNHYIVWSAPVNVCPGLTYDLSFEGCDISGTSPPQLDWYINGTLSSGPYNMPLGPGVWQNFSRTWTAAAGQTSATFSIRVRNPVAGGSDIGLDDISLSTTLTLTDTIQVNVIPPPPLDLGPDLSLCTGQTRVLHATTPGATYGWQDGSQSDTYTVSAPGTYSVTVTQGVCNVSDAVNVTYQQPPSIDLGPDISLCNSNATILDATTPGATYVWQNGSTNPTFLVVSPGHYTVAVTVGDCTTSDAVDVTFHAPPHVDLGPPIALCQGQSASFDVTVANGSYTWEDGSSSPTRTVSTPGHYSVTVTANTCVITDAVDVTVDPMPVAALPADSSLCQGQSLHLDATYPGASYRWQDGSTNATFEATATGTYSVDVTLGQCTASDAIDVVVRPLPGIGLGPDTTICAGTSLQLDATVAGATYRWQDGSTDATFNATNAGTYSVTVDLHGCTASDSRTITVQPLPVFDLGLDRTVCPGTSVTFDATTADAGYRWSDGSTAATLTTDVPGTYGVDVTVGTCTAHDQVQLSNFSLPIVDLGPDVSVCIGTPVLLSVNVPGATCVWSDGSTGNAVNATTTGWWWVDVTSNSCTVRDSVHVAIEPFPIVDLGADALVCPGATYPLDATTANASYLWNDGSMSATLAAGVGEWNVRVTVNGCSTRDTVVIGERTPPSVDLGPDTLLCPGFGTDPERGLRPGCRMDRWQHGHQPHREHGRHLWRDGHGCLRLHRQRRDRRELRFTDPGEAGFRHHHLPGQHARARRYNARRHQLCVEQRGHRSQAPRERDRHLLGGSVPRPVLRHGHDPSSGGGRSIGAAAARYHALPRRHPAAERECR